MRQVRAIRNSLKDHTENLRTLEQGLIADGIYRKNPTTGGWELREDAVKDRPVAYRENYKNKN